MKYTATLRELLEVGVSDNKEKLVPISDWRIRCEYLPWMNDMEAIVWKKILVRETVSKMLSKVQDIIEKKSSKICLHVTYWYRALKIQKERFEWRCESLQKQWLSWDKLFEVAHQTVAHPDVAWHPTWGAVDVLLRDKDSQKHLDFWSEIYNYNNNMHEILAFEKTDWNTTQKENRKFLRTVMSAGWFTPYDLEYWHFSYWDKERWYHDWSKAIYEQVNL